MFECFICTFTTDADANELITDIINTDLDPGDSDTAEFVINCGTQGGCHDVTVTVDYTHFIDECDEQNNTDEETVCCRQ